MKDLLSKEHYCYKIHILVIKSSAYPSAYVISDLNGEENGEMFFENELQKKIKQNL